MVMDVKFEHVFVKGIHKIKVAGFRVIRKSQLPDEYTEAETLPKCYTQDIWGKTTLFVQDANGSKLLRFNNYVEGQIIKLENMAWIVSTMEAAGHRLYRINKKLADEQSKWEGKVEVYKF